jgi:hypothetical protein
MSKNKNALREHFIATYGAGTQPTADSTDWLPLALNISTITDDSDEKTDTGGDYAGDGSEVETFTGRTEKWTVEGDWDPTDPAQVMIDGLKREQTDEGRMIFHKIVETSGKIIIGPAKALGIVTGSGDATDYEDFKLSISHTKAATITEPDDTP